MYPSLLANFNSIVACMQTLVLPPYAHELVNHSKVEGKESKQVKSIMIMVGAPHHTKCI